MTAKGCRNNGNERKVSPPKFKDQLRVRKLKRMKGLNRRVKYRNAHDKYL